MEMKGENLFKTTISKEEISNLQTRIFEGEIFYIDTFEKLLQVIPIINQVKTFGFDTETKPAFKKGVSNRVSLLQLAASEKVFLFRLNKIGLPEELRNLLSDASVQKIGVAIKDDIASLRKLGNFEPGGFVDLQPYVKEFGIADNSLRKLAANVLGFKISKRQQTSNWEADILSKPQIEYAATDAWVCYEIYNTLRNNQ
jgi:ribonuclease D